VKKGVHNWFVSDTSPFLLKEQVLYPFTHEVDPTPSPRRATALYPM
jgi:hypothetical protein